MAGVPPVTPLFSNCPQCGNPSLERRPVELDFVTTQISAEWGFKPLVVDYCASCGYVDPEYDGMVDAARQARHLSMEREVVR